MADHYLRAVEQTTLAAELSERLKTEHSRRDHRAPIIAALHEEKRNALALAKIHATLYVGTMIEQLGLHR